MTINPQRDEFYGRLKALSDTAAIEAGLAVEAKLAAARPREAAASELLSHLLKRHTDISSGAAGTLLQSSLAPRHLVRIGETRVEFYCNIEPMRSVAITVCPVDGKISWVWKKRGMFNGPLTPTGRADTVEAGRVSTALVDCLIEGLLDQDAFSATRPPTIDPHSFPRSVR